MGDLKAGDALYRVYEGFRTLVIERVTVKKVTRQVVWFNEQLAAFGYRSRMDTSEAERCGRSEADAIQRHIDSCANEIRFHENRIEAAKKLQAQVIARLVDGCEG